MATGSACLTHRDQLRNSQYTNWVKAGLSLKYFKGGVEEFVDACLRLQQESLLSVLKNELRLTSVHCDQCTLQNLLPHKARSCGRGKSCHCYMQQNKRPCPKNICGKLYERIIVQHRYGSPSWHNTDISKWCTDHWEIGKCFLDKKGYKERRSTIDTDCKGLLNIIINNLFIHSSIDEPIDPPNDTFSKIKSARNEVLHSPTLELTEVSLNDLIKDMTNALNDKKCLKGSQRSEEAIQKLLLLKSDKFIIRNNDEMEIRKSALEAIQEAKEDAIKALEDKQEEIIQTIQVDELKDRVVKLGQSVECLSSKQANVDLSLQSLTTLQTQHSKNEADLLTMKQKMTSMENDVNTLPSINSRLDCIEKRQRVLDTDVAGIQDIQKNVMVELKQMQNDILQFKLRSNEENKTEISHQQKIAYLKTKAEFQRFLCNLYDTYLSTIPVSPVLEEIDSRIEDTYVELTITDDLVRHVERDHCTVPREVNGYSDILTKNGKRCKNVYVLGDAGIGKTTWCLKVLRSWSISLKKIDTAMSANEKFISENFDIVLFVSLRHASKEFNVCDMIQSQLFEEYPHMFESALEIIRNEPEQCLLICDGLDEWIPQQFVVETSPLYNADLPGRKYLNGAVIVTTTRPWKLDHVRLSDKHIDRSVTIEGFSTHRKVMTLATKIISHLNKTNRSVLNRNVVAFETELKASFRLHPDNNKPTILRFPLLLTYVICKWYDDGTFGGNVALNYMNMFEFLFNHIDRKGRLQNKQNVQQVFGNYKVPYCIENRPSCLKYTNILEKLASFAFKTLLCEQEESKLVFTKEEISLSLSDDELKVSTETGLLSKSKAVGKTLSKLSKLTFLHKTIQECLCALHIVYEIVNDRVNDLGVLVRHCYSKKKRSEYENLILFICGLDRKSGSALSEHLANIADSELDLNNHRVPATLDLIVKCAEEFDGIGNVSCANSSYIIRTHMVYFGKANTMELLYRMDSLFERNKEHVTILEMTISSEAGHRNKLKRMLAFFCILRNIKSAVNLKILKIENMPASGIDIGRYLRSFEELINLEEFALKDTSAISRSKEGSDKWVRQMKLDLSSCRKLTKLQVVECLHELVINSSLPMQFVDVEYFGRAANMKTPVFIYVSSNTYIKRFSIRNYSSVDCAIKVIGIHEAERTNTPIIQTTARIESVKVGFSGCAETVFDSRFEIHEIDVVECSCCKFPVASLKSLNLGNRITKRVSNIIKCSLQLRKLTLTGLHDDDLNHLKSVLPLLPCLEVLELDSPGDTLCFLQCIGELSHLRSIKLSFWLILELENFLAQLHHLSNLQILDIKLTHAVFTDVLTIQFLKEISRNRKYMSKDIEFEQHDKDCEIQILGAEASFRSDMRERYDLIRLFDFKLLHMSECNEDTYIDYDELKKAGLDMYVCGVKKSQIEAYLSTVYFRSSGLDTLSIRGLSKLTTLKLGGITPDMFVRFGVQFKFLSNLKTIELRWLLWMYVDTERVFGCLKNLVSLECLALRHVSHACYRAVSDHFVNLERLQTLEVDDCFGWLCPSMLRKVSDIKNLKTLKLGIINQAKARVLWSILSKLTSLEYFYCKGSGGDWCAFMFFDFTSLKCIKSIHISELDIELDQWKEFETRLPVTRCLIDLEDATINQDDVIDHIKTSDRFKVHKLRAVEPFKYNILFTLTDNVKR